MSLPADCAACAQLGAELCEGCAQLLWEALSLQLVDEHGPDPWDTYPPSLRPRQQDCPRLPTQAVPEQ